MTRFTVLYSTIYVKNLSSSHPNGQTCQLYTEWGLCTICSYAGRNALLIHRPEKFVFGSRLGFTYQIFSQTLNLLLFPKFLTRWDTQMYSHIALVKFKGKEKHFIKII